MLWTPIQPRFTALPSGRSSTWKWPLLASHLRRRPQDLVHLGEETPATDIEAELALVFADPVAQRLADGLPGVKLTADDIVRFSAPPGRARPRVMTVRLRTPAAA